MKILKYELAITDEQTIPIGDLYAKPIAVAEQGGKLMFWAETDITRNPPNNYEILVKIVGTGHPFGHVTMPYIGTVVMSNGFVWHVYALWRLAQEGRDGG